MEKIDIVAEAIGIGVDRLRKYTYANELWIKQVLRCCSTTYNSVQIHYAFDEDNCFYASSKLVQSKRHIALLTLKDDEAEVNIYISDEGMYFLDFNEEVVEKFLNRHYANNNAGNVAGLLGSGVVCSNSIVDTMYSLWLYIYTKENHLFPIDLNRYGYGKVFAVADYDGGVETISVYSDAQRTVFMDSWTLADALLDISYFAATLLVATFRNCMIYNSELDAAATRTLDIIRRSKKIESDKMGEYCTVYRCNDVSVNIKCVTIHILDSNMVVTVTDMNGYEYWFIYSTSRALISYCSDVPHFTFFFDEFYNNMCKVEPYIMRDKKELKKVEPKGTIDHTQVLYKVIDDTEFKSFARVPSSADLYNILYGMLSSGISFDILGTNEVVAVSVKKVDISKYSSKVTLGVVYFTYRDFTHELYLFSDGNWYINDYTGNPWILISELFRDRDTKEVLLHLGSIELSVQCAFDIVTTFVRCSPIVVKGAYGVCGKTLTVVDNERGTWLSMIVDNMDICRSYRLGNRIPYELYATLQVVLDSIVETHTIIPKASSQLFDSLSELFPSTKGIATTFNTDTSSGSSKALVASSDSSRNTIAARLTSCRDDGYLISMRDLHTNVIPKDEKINSFINKFLNVIGH